MILKDRYRSTLQVGVAKTLFQKERPISGVKAKWAQVVNIDAGGGDLFEAHFHQSAHSP